MGQIRARNSRRVCGAARFSTLAPIAGLTAALAIAAVAPAGADEVRLANGDRLTGTAVRLAEGKLALATAYAGEIAIDWSQVVALATDEPVRVVLDDDTRLNGVVSAADGSGGATPSGEAPRLRIAVEGLAEPVEVALGAVRAINPRVEPAVRLSGSLSAGLLASRGNTDTDTTYVEGELVARSKKNRYSLGASAKEAEDDGRKTASRTHGYARYDHFISERWYFNSNSSFTEDEFQDLNLRTTIGLASGYQVFDSERRKLSVELGASYVNEDFIASADDSFPAGRWSLEFARKLAGARVELFHRHEGLVGFESTDDLLLRTQTGARFALVGKLVATAQLNVDYDKSPAPGRETTDRTYLLSLGFDW